MQEEGYIAKILYDEGAKDIELGKNIAILVENKEDIAAFANYVEGAEAPAASEPVSAAATPEPAAAAQADLPWHIKLEMPNLSPTMEKVSKSAILNQCRETFHPGPKLWETRLRLEMFWLQSRPTKLQ